MVPPLPHLKREVPEIDGSPAGFIALVVILSVIIIASCVAVFFLLRDHEPSDAQRATRRSRYMREIEREAVTGSPQPTPQSLTERVKRIWRTKGYPSAARRNGTGWVQATGDEWETDSASGDTHETGMRVVSGARLSLEIPRAYSDPYARSDYGHTTSDNNHGSPPVRIVDSPGSDGFDPFRIPAQYLDPYHEIEAKQPPPSENHGHYEENPADRRISIRTVNAERARSPEVHNHKHLSTQSTASVRTFEGGTKFLEAL